MRTSGYYWVLISKGSKLTIAEYTAGLERPWKVIGVEAALLEGQLYKVGGKIDI